MPAGAGFLESGAPNVRRTATRAITFDLWHTLLYLEPDAEERYMRRQEELAVELLAGDGAGRGAARTAFRLERAAAVAASERGRVVPVGQQILRAARSLGAPDRSAAYLEAMRREIGRTRFRRAPGALAVLRSLRRQGLRIGLISNTVGEPGRCLRPVLARLGLAPYFDALRFSDEERWCKPAPGIFRDLLAEFGVRPRDAIHVGDGWSDLEGARRAGLRAAVLYTGLQRYGPAYRKTFTRPLDGVLGTIHRIDRLAQLPAMAAALLDPDGASPRPPDSA